MTGTPGCSGFRVILAAALSFGAVAGQTARAAELSLTFEPVAFPMSVADKVTFTASASVTIDGQSYAIAYNNLLKPGDRLGGAVFGQLVDINGTPMVDKDGAPNICDKPDFMSLIKAGGKIFMINQFECRPAVMYLTELSQDVATGALIPVSTRPIDFSGVNGAARHCAGMVTPWNTHLSSEEDLRDARKLKANGRLDKRYKQIATYLAGRKPASPYMWGWVPEVSILNGAGDTRVVKHFAMGRLSTEIAYALPDERSVFLTEDNTNSPLVMFVADAARDLSAGTLYAAKWTQNGGGGASGTLEWINLGHATNDEIGELIAAPTTFDQLFDTAKPGGTGTVPPGSNPSTPSSNTNASPCGRAWKPPPRGWRRVAMPPIGAQPPNSVSWRGRPSIRTPAAST